MNSIHTLLNHPLVESTGWALIHFVWQAAAIAALLALAMLMLRHASSGAKYVACCLSLLLMAAAPLVTTFWLLPGDVADPSSGRSGVTQILDVLQGRRVASGSAQQVQQLLLEARDKRRAELNGGPTVDTTPTRPAQTAPESITLSAWLQSHLSWVVSLWSLGVVLLSARLLMCWLNVGRLSRVGTSDVPGAITSRFRDLANRVGVSRTVHPLESSLVRVPTVLGALSPVILLPATAVTGLSASQLEAILAHELAHVRRHDYLVNLLQTAIETLLFYHPAVWWLSRRIRQERENCCDDVASSVCGNRLEYAQALVRMEEVRSTTPRLAVASTGGSLTQRVRRLIGAPVQPPHEGRRGWWLGGVIPIALLMFAASCISKVATDGPGGGTGTSGPDDTYVVVWGAVLDRPLADQLLAGATKFDEQEGWTLQTTEAARLREQLHAAADSEEIIRLYQRMNWLAPLSIDIPPEHLTGTLINGDNVQFREPGDRAHILFLQNIIGVHRVLPAADHVRLKLQTRHSARFEAFNTADGDAESEHRGQIEVDHRITNGNAMLVTRALDPLLDWSPVVISVFEPVRVPSRNSQQRQIHDLPTWLAEGPQGVRRRAKAADDWTRTAKPVSLAGKWSQLLESGSRVTLVGLSSPKHCPTAWWTPDGHPLQFDFDPNVTVLPPAELIALLHVVHTPNTEKALGPVDLNALVNTTSSLMTGGVRYLSGSDRTAMSNPADGQLVIVRVEAEDESTLEIGLGTGTDSDQHVGVVNRDEPLQVDAGEFRAAQILERNLHTFGKVTDVSMRHPSNREREVLVTAVKNDGEKVTSQYVPRVYVGRNTSSTASVFDRFLIHPDQVTHFEVGTAPLVWATFSGFTGFPAALRERLTAAADEPTPVLALVGWVFQGDETAFNDLLNGAKPRNLGDKLSWFRDDSERIRRQYLKLRNDGHADPPGPNVGTLVDFGQFMKISGIRAYRGPVLSSFPFRYSTGILPLRKRASTQDGMWTMEADVVLSSAEDRAWQIGGRWLVQENKPNAAGRSQWSDVFDQKLKLATKLPPGRVAVITGPVQGMDKSDRTGFVVLECIPLPHTQVMNVRGLDKDVEKLLRQGPLLALTTLDDPESPEESDEKPKSRVSVRGFVLDAETGEPITKFITQAGRVDPKDPKKVQWGFSESRNGSAREGRFSTTVRWDAGWTARILADGYLPQPVITEAPEKGQTRIEVELRLKRGRWVRGRVVNHEGKPAQGVSVYGLGKRGINLAGGLAQQSFGGTDTSRVRAITDDHGRFELAIGEASGLAVSSPKIDAWPGELPEGMKEALIKLPKPGRVVINFDIEGAEEKTKVFRQLLGHQTPGFEGIRSEVTVEVENGGKLEVASLPPGTYQIARSRMLRTGQMGMGQFLDRH